MLCVQADRLKWKCYEKQKLKSLSAFRIRNKESVAKVTGYAMFVIFSRPFFVCSFLFDIFRILLVSIEYYTFRRTNR